MTARTDSLMPACVLVLKERASAETLYGSLQDAGVPLTRVALVAPDQVDPGQGVLTPEPMEQVELLNPSIARNRRQKSMSRWLLPFGFMAGLTFTQGGIFDTNLHLCLHYSKKDTFPFTIF